MTLNLLVAGHSFVRRMENCLDDSLGLNFNTKTCGQGGLHVDQLEGHLSTFKRRNPHFAPDFVVVLIGDNDVLRWKDDPSGLALEMANLI